MLSTAKQTTFGLHRIVSSYTGSICQIYVTGSYIDINNNSQLTHYTASNPVLTKLYNQSFVSPSYSPRYIPVSSSLSYFSGEIVADHPNFNVTLSANIQSIFLTCAATSSSELIRFGQTGNSMSYDTGKLTVNACLSSSIAFETYTRTDRLNVFELKSSVNSEYVSVRRRDRPELRQAVDVYSYVRINGEIEYNSTGSFSNEGNSVFVCAGSGSKFSEIIISTRSPKIPEGGDIYSDIVRRHKWKTIDTTNATGSMAQIIDAGMNCTFTPISYWEGAEGLSSGIIDHGYVPIKWISSSVSGSLTIATTPSGKDCYQVGWTSGSALGQTHHSLRGNYSSSLVTPNFNKSGSFSINMFIKNDGSLENVNKYIFLKNRLKLALRQDAVRSVVSGSINSSASADCSISGRAAFSTNSKWCYAGLSYSDIDKQLRVYTGGMDVVVQDTFSYLPLSTDTNIVLGGDYGTGGSTLVPNSGSIPSAKIAAFMFLPHSINHKTAQLISSYWHEKYGSAGSKSELLSGIDYTGKTVGDIDRLSYLTSRQYREEITPNTEVLLSSDGIFTVSGSNEVTSFTCPITKNTYTFSANPPVRLETDIKQGTPKLVIPVQTNSQPVSMSLVNTDFTGSLSMYLGVRDKLDKNAQTYFKVTDSSNRKFEVYRVSGDYNTYLKSTIANQTTYTTSFPSASYATGSFTTLKNIYNHPLPIRSLFRYWSRTSSGYNSSGALGKNLAWVNGGSVGLLLIENQRWAKDCAMAGILGYPKNEGNPDETNLIISPEGNIQRAIRFINWGWTYQVMDSQASNYGGFNTVDGVHSASFFLEAAAFIYKLFQENGDSGYLFTAVRSEGYSNLSQLFTSWLPKLSLLGYYVGNTEVWNPVGNPATYRDELDPFTHRFFLRGWGVWLAGHLNSDTTLKTKGEDLIKIGLHKQTASGVNPERRSLDTSYQCVGCSFVGLYGIISGNTTLDGVNIHTFVQNAMDMALDQMDYESGKVIYEGYRATTELNRVGGHKTFDMKFFSVACAVSDALLGGSKYSDYGARVISESKRYHDITTLCVLSDAFNASLVVDNYNESPSVTAQMLSSPVSIQFGNGTSELEIFQFTLVSSPNNASAVLSTSADILTWIKNCARMYGESVNESGYAEVFLPANDQSVATPP